MNKVLLIILASILIITGLWYGIYRINNLHVTAVFDELEPFPHNINVYYKGFRLGRSTKVYPSKDFTQTYVDMNLHMDDFSLPDNITAKVKTKNKRDYIELIYPDAPSITYLKNNSRIKGVKGVNITSFIQDQADAGNFDDLADNLSETVEDAGETMKALTDLFHTANDILTDLRPLIKESGENLAVTTRNLTVASDNIANISIGLNRSAKPQILDNTFSNIELITRNLELTTSNTALLTKRVDSETTALLNCLIKNVNTVILNINDIIKGFKSTLSKRFAGMRLIFGKPINEQS